MTIKPLSQVDEAFAWDEGEGDRTRDWRLDAHRRYFARQAMREGLDIDDEILTVFERFQVVWPLDVADLRRHGNAPLTNPVIHSFRLYLNR